MNQVTKIQNLTTTDDKQVVEMEVNLVEDVKTADFEASVSCIDALNQAGLPSEWAAFGLEKGHGYKRVEVKSNQIVNLNQATGETREGSNEIISYRVEQTQDKILEVPMESPEIINPNLPVKLGSDLVKINTSDKKAIKMTAIRKKLQIFFHTQTQLYKST